MSSNFNHASFIWSAADLLRGTYKQHQYGDIILPFTVLSRLDAVLAPTKQAVLEATKGLDPDVDPSPGMLRAKAGHTYSFSNRSNHDLKSLQGDPDNLEQNLRDYVNSFSSNVRDIFEKYKFEDTIVDLAQNDLLLQILQHFAKVDLHPKAVDNEKMGHIFEELIRKFAEASNETAGEHFTPREVVKLMVSILLANEEDLMTPGIVRDVYDPTAGTGGMLSVADDEIKAMNGSAQVNLLGQELNGASYAICKADMVVKGQPIDNIVNGDTLMNPAFKNRTFHYGLSNPPFGVNWQKQREAVTSEHEIAGFDGRFGAGLPRVSDGSMLFLMHLISKLREPSDSSGGGKGAIVLNGSPLFTGGAGSGESNIRKWILDNDYLETIVGLPTDMFYNTGISTYVWILNKDKPAERRNKVQLIDATEMFVKMRKSVGSKRKELSDDHIVEITKLYEQFEESDVSKIFDVTDFMYRTITLERPMKRNYGFTPERIERAMAAKPVTKLDEDAQGRLLEVLEAAGVDAGGELSFSRTEFQKQLMAAANGKGVALKPALVKMLVDELSEHDDDGELLTKAGRPVADAALRDTENVPWNEDIDEYLEREVKPFVPDAWIDESKSREGAEIQFTRHFYNYVPPRSLEEIDADLDEVLGRIRARLEQVKA
ncbi:type I restriction-modification system subunit M [Gulosibacter molinativorax]|uniref:site-specific DNA-methyltransferase (adenine-specific) n=1 Tax=Gulosibacter molinativorax TaxID=256821 RepID=A0ABT7C9K5_9MICO|nr:class I SAM-dependent DNA methyltransferase [Gulosibacter molinativorax]MDJ1371888.1 SAM-dependent DNA methyltransferase [Gulosibacter molinativorax]QUY62535.1 Type I restriction-modification system modification subunit [Gulosibacter molinativorax]